MARGNKIMKKCKNREGKRARGGLPLQTRKGWGKASLIFEWDTGISGGGTSWAEEIANAKPLHLERSLSCLRYSKNASVIRQAWTLRGQGGKWGHVTEGFIGHWKDLGFYSEIRNHGEFWAQEWHHLLSPLWREQTVRETRAEGRG